MSSDDCLKKNNSKKACKLVQDLTGTKQERTTTIQDKGGTRLTENEDMLKRWAVYCSELYNYKATGDPEVLNVSPATNNANHPILREEVEAAVKSLKKESQQEWIILQQNYFSKGKKPWSTPYLIICNKIWRTRGWPTPWTQSPVIASERTAIFSYARTTAPSVLLATQAKSC